jgi:hypothetical protein
MKQILALLLLLIGAKAHGHIMLGQNIQQFDEVLGAPITKVDGMPMYKWGSDSGTGRWLAALFDNNGTVQTVFFYKKGLDFVPGEYSDMDQVMPEGSYTWQAIDTSKLPLQLPTELDKRAQYNGLWISGNYAIANTVLRAGGTDPKYTTLLDIFARGYARQDTTEIQNKVFDELNRPEFKLTPAPKPDDDWLTSWLIPLNATSRDALLALICIKLLWPKTIKTNQFGIRFD